MFANELLQKLLGRLFNDGIIPALFAWPYLPELFDKQPQKIKARTLREEVRSKSQFCELIYELNELIKRSEVDFNTKTTQTETENVTTISTSSQSKPKMIDVSIQREIEDACLNVEQLPDNETLVETEWRDCEQSSEELESEFENIKQLSFFESNISESEKPLKAAFIVYWSSLLIFLKKMLTPFLLFTGCSNKRSSQRFTIDSEDKMPKALFIQLRTIF